MNDIPVVITQERLQALNRLHDLVSDHIAENPSADPDLQAIFAEALSACVKAQNIAPDRSAGVGEPFRQSLITHAREVIVGDDLAVDDDAQLSPAAGGVWLQCWTRFSLEGLSESTDPQLRSFEGC